MAEKKFDQTLTSQIKMALDLEDKGGVVDAFADINTAAESLGKSFKTVQEAMNLLSKNPLESIKQDLNSITMGDASIHARDVKKAIEDKIRTAIIKARIELADDDGNKTAIKVRMGQKFWDENKLVVEKAIGEALSNIVIDQGSIPPIQLGGVMREFVTRFNEQIFDAVKDADMFNLYKVKDGKEIFKYKSQFKLNEGSVKSIMESLQDSFVTHLSKSDNIILQEIPPLEIKSDKLSEIVNKIGSSIGDIDKLIKVDPDALKNLPDISGKMQNFRDGLSQMVVDINSLANQLESLKFGDITEGDVKKATTSIDSLKNKVTVKVDKWAKDLAKELSASITKDTDLTQLKEALNGINDYIDLLVVNKLTQLKADVDTITVNRSEGDTAMIQQLPNTIITKITDQVVSKFLEAGALDLELDPNFLNDKIEGWRDGFYVDMGESIETLLRTIYDGIDYVLDAADISVTGELARQLDKIKTFTRSVDGTGESPGDVLKGEVTKLKQTLDNSIKDYITNVLSTAEFKVTSQDFEGIELPKSTNTKIKKLIKQSIDNRIDAMTAHLTEAGDGANQEEITKIISKLNKHATMLTNHVLRNVNQTLTNIRGQLRLSTGDMDKSTDTLMRSINPKLKSLTNVFIQSLGDTLGNNVITSTGGQGLKTKLEDSIKTAISQADIKLDTNIELNLEGVIQNIVRTIENEVKNIVAKWQPLPDVNISKKSTNKLKGEAIASEQTTTKVTELNNIVKEAIENIFMSQISQIKNSLANTEISNLETTDTTFNTIFSDINNTLNTTKTSINGVLNKYVTEIKDINLRINELVNGTSGAGLTIKDLPDITKEQFENIAPSSKGNYEYFQRQFGSAREGLRRSLNSIIAQDIEWIAKGERDGGWNDAIPGDFEKDMRMYKSRLSGYREELEELTKLDTESLNELKTTQQGKFDNLKSEISRVTQEMMNSFEEIPKNMSSIVSTIAKEIGKSTESYTKKFLTDLDSQIQQHSIPQSYRNQIKTALNKSIKALTDEMKLKLDGIELTTERTISIKLDSAIKQIEKELRQYVANITIKVDSNRELSIKTSKIDSEISKYITKAINTSVAGINKVKPTASEAVAGVELLRASIGEYIQKSIEGYNTALKESVNKKFSAKGMGYIFDRVVSVFNKAFYNYAEQISSTFENMNVGDFSVLTSELNSDVKRRVATKLGVTPRELTRQVPEFRGTDYGKEIMRANMEVITDSVNKLINTNLKTLMDYYKESLKDSSVEPDSAVTGYILDEIKKFQDTIIKKVKDMVRDQFRFLTDEINQMNIEAKSLGYRPTQAFSQAVARANPNLTTDIGLTAGEVKEQIKSMIANSRINIDNVTMQGVAVTADDITSMSVDDIRANAVNSIITEAPQVVVNGKVVDLNAKDFDFSRFTLPMENYLSNLPFNNEMGLMLPQLNKLKADDFIKGSAYANPYNTLNIDSLSFGGTKIGGGKHGLSKIFQNMARYFFVGYALQLPIKAITAANKVSTELDYRIAKARQNILIKDPTMTNTARSVVYDRYTNEGKDVRGTDFQTDVGIEAKKLRNIMKTEMSDYLINISKAYYQDIGKVGQYYEIASRRSKDPYETLTKTREIAKILAAESDMDSEFAGTGLEAMSAQWGVKAGELDRYTNMMLKTAMLSNTTVTDLLSTQRDTAAMFKGRLEGKDMERDYATAMALSAMFVESTGKSGREAGTFWRNVLQRPYVKDSRKYIEGASQYAGFEGLDPYYTDEQGVRRQKDFLTMFSDIMEATLKVDDPSKMTMLSEIFPIRTIGGAESVMALVEDMKKDMETTLLELKQTGQIDANATLEDVSIKEVFEKYIDTIMEVTDRDIAGYIAGLQDTTKFNWQGLVTQWEATVYSVFMEFKEESSVAMSYFRRVLEMFEENSGTLSEVIKVFAKIGTGLAGKNFIEKGIARYNERPIKPTDFQKGLATDYNTIRVAEHATRNRMEAIQTVIRPIETERERIRTNIETLKVQRDELNSFIEHQRTLPQQPKPTPRGSVVLDPNTVYRDSGGLSKAQASWNYINDQISSLDALYAKLDTNLTQYNNILDSSKLEHKRMMDLSTMLYNGMGARNLSSFESMYSDLYRNEYAYNKLAEVAIRAKVGVSGDYYGNIYSRKEALEAEMATINNTRFANEAQMRANREILDSPEYKKGYKRKEVTALTNENLRLLNETTGLTNRFTTLGSELDLATTELSKLSPEILAAERLIFEANRPKMGTDGGLTEKSNREITAFYRELLPSAGINVAGFESGLDKLAMMFKGGAVDVDLYEESLRDISRQLGIADGDFAKFKESVRQINTEVQSGTASVLEYINALKMAQNSRNGVLGNTTIGNPDATTPETTGTGLGNAATALAGGAVINSVARGGGISKLLAKLTALLGGGAGKLVAGSGAALALGGKLALLYATTDLIGKVMGGVTERKMTEGNRLTNEADKYDSMINKQISFRVEKTDGDIAAIAKSTLGGTLLLYDSLANQVNRWAGGTAPSFMDTWKIDDMIRKNYSMDKNELANMIKDQFGVEDKRFEGGILKQEEQLSKNPFIDPTGKNRDFTGEKAIQIPLEELMNFIERELTKLNNKLTESTAGHTQEKLRLLIKGEYENSKNMREAMERYLERNIAELQDLVESFQSYLEVLNPGTENYTVMKMQILDLENRIDENKLQLIKNEFSAYDELMEKFNREDTNSQARFDIKKYDALLSGIKEDSGAIRQIESKFAETQINSINKLQSKLSGLADQFKDQPDRYDKIMDQMLQLDVEKRRLLYEIKEKLPGRLSTFNLPSEIQPITYYEAMTRRNTHKNMSVRAGDTIVNVNIDNMSGSDDDIGRLGKAVSNAVNQAQRGFVRQFANNVKSGMGNNYYSWNNY